MRRTLERKGLWLRIICAVALLFLGLAHRPPVQMAPVGFMELAYQLPDGSAPDLCVPQGSDKGMVSYPVCDACRLAAAVLLPPAPEDISYVARAEAPLYVMPTVPPVGQRFDRAMLARGPPSFPVA